MTSSMHSLISKFFALAIVVLLGAFVSENATAQNCTNSSSIRHDQNPHLTSNQPTGQPHFCDINTRVRVTHPSSDHCGECEVSRNSSDCIEIPNVIYYTIAGQREGPGGYCGTVDSCSNTGTGAAVRSGGLNCAGTACATGYMDIDPGSGLNCVLAPTSAHHQACYEADFEMPIATRGFSGTTPPAGICRAATNNAADIAVCGLISPVGTAGVGSFTAVLEGACALNDDCTSTLFLILPETAERTNRVFLVGACPTASQCTGAGGFPDSTTGQCREPVQADCADSFVFTAGTPSALATCTECAVNEESTGGNACTACEVNEAREMGEAACMECPANEVPANDGSCEACPDHHVRMRGEDSCRLADCDVATQIRAVSGACVTCGTNQTPNGAGDACVCISGSNNIGTAEEPNCLDPCDVTTSPIFDSSISRCRTATDDQECGREYPFAPILALNGGCRPAEEDSECLRAYPAFPIRQFDGSCGPLICDENPKYVPLSGGGCRLVNADDCADTEYFSSNGTCDPVTIEYCKTVNSRFVLVPAQSVEVDGSSSICGCPDGEALVDGECVPGAGGITCQGGLVPTGGVCGRPTNVAQCRSHYPDENYSAIENGVCVESCSAALAPDAAGVCRDLSALCQDGQVFVGGSCRDPQTGAECVAAGTGSVIENGACEAACDGDRVANSEGVCGARPLSPEECFAQSQVIGEGVCRAPRLGSECVDAGLGTVVESGRCRGACTGDRIANDEGVCESPPLEERLCDVAGQVFADGACRSPLRASECAEAGLGTVIENGVCADSCLGGRSPDADGFCQSESSPRICVTGYVLDAASRVCREPRNDGECAEANALLPKFDDRGTPGDAEDDICRALTQAECRPQVSDPGTAGNCRSPQDNSECAALFGDSLPILGESGRCVAPRNNDECRMINPRMPVLGADGNCRERASDGVTSGDCADGRVLVRASAGLPPQCRNPQSVGECAAHYGASAGYDWIENSLCVRECSDPQATGRTGGLCEPTAAPSTGGSAATPVVVVREDDDDSPNELLIIAPAIVGLHFLFSAARPRLGHHFGFSADDAGGDTWTSGGRIEFEEENYRSYVVAAYGSGPHGAIVETGGSYGADPWRVSYYTKETQDDRDYDLSAGVDWQAGSWDLRPNWRAGFAYDATGAEWTSSSNVGLDISRVFHKWRIRQNSWLAWDSGGDLNAPKINLDIERRF